MNSKNFSSLSLGHKSDEQGFSVSKLIILVQISCKLSKNPLHFRRNYPLLELPLGIPKKSLQVFTPLECRWAALKAKFFV